MREFLTESADETRAVGGRLAPYLRPGDVLALEGTLGSGKTTLIQGMMRELGVRDRVQSPSFVLVRTYQAKFTVKHVDLYRLDPRDVEGLYLEEVYEEEGIMFVEWAERTDSLPGTVSRIQISFVPTDSEDRRIQLEGPLEKRLS